MIGLLLSVNVNDGLLPLPLLLVAVGIASSDDDDDDDDNDESYSTVAIYSMNFFDSMSIEDISVGCNCTLLGAIIIVKHVVCAS
jgi:hypothetical protein